MELLTAFLLVGAAGGFAGWIAVHLLVGFAAHLTDAVNETRRP